VEPRQHGNANEDNKICLTPEQQNVVDTALRGHNIFLTGAAGCGKTVTLKKLLATFKEGNIAFQVVAPTGMAALPLGGKTTCSFLGWKPDALQTPIKKLMKYPSESVRKAVKRIQVLIIEEISMVENQTLERMNLVIQAILEDDRPFGGKQVIFTGDFHQLPPVKPFDYCLQCGNQLLSKPPEHICKDCPAGNAEVVFYDEDKWAFEAAVWKDLKLKNIRLKQLHRQKDTRFQDILNKIRNGILLSADEWQDLERKKDIPAGIYPVRLMPKRKQVDEFNKGQLKAITSPAKSWQAIDSYQKLKGDWSGSCDTPWKTDQPLKYHSFEGKLSLKIGAKVVLLVNLDPEAKLVNGSQGEVIGFEEVEGVEPGPTESSLAISSEGDNFRSNFEPIVRFANGQIKTISPVKRDSRCGTNQRPYLAARTQIPLLLAWALSIHKSQGMTLDYVDISSKDVFEPGQLYVGLSRGTSLEGLTLSGNSRKQLPTDPDVLSFYETTEWESSPTAED
jgi:ATP-dependent DNA helicase PIF1